MADYYRALPYANGLPHWEPAPAAWHGGPEPWPPPRRPATVEQLEEMADADLADAAFHPVAAVVDGKVVGGSAMLSFEVMGGAAAADAVVAALELIVDATSLGGIESTIERRGKHAGEEDTPPSLLRLNVGCEHVEDLWADLAGALDRLT